MDDLNRQSVNARKAGAPGFVPADDFIKTSQQRCCIQWTGAVDGDRLVVDGGGAGQLGVKPDLFLTVREGRRPTHCWVRSGDRGIRRARMATNGNLSIWGGENEGLL